MQGKGGIFIFHLFYLYLIMVITDVISVQQAKDWLQVDFPDEDPAILRLINSAVQWVEKYTYHYLYARTITKYTRSCQTGFPEYPINSFSVTDKTDTPLDPQPTPYYGATKTYVTCPVQSKVVLQVGYSTLNAIPSPLVEAVYKLITYLYENRDAYGTTLPIDVQLLINQYRRSPTL